jgi:hypothetical protein
MDAQTKTQERHSIPDIDRCPYSTLSLANIEELFSSVRVQS